MVYPGTSRPREPTHAHFTEHVECVLRCLFVCQSFKEAVIEKATKSQHMLHALKKVFLDMKQREQLEPEAFLKIHVAHVKQNSGKKDLCQFTITLLETFAREGTSFLHNILTGRRIWVTNCKACYRERENPEETYSYMTVPWKESYMRLSDMLEQVITRDTQCKNCPKKAQEKLKLVTLPHVLVLFVKSISAKSPLSEKAIKLEKLLDVEAILSASKASSSKGYLYGLKGVIFQHSSYCTAIMDSSDEPDVSPLWKNHRGGKWVEDKFETIEKKFSRNATVPVIFFYVRTNMASSQKTRTDAMLRPEEPLGIPAKTNLQNTGCEKLGNSSIITSVVQALFMCTSFRNQLLGLAIEEKDKCTLTYAIQEVFDRLHRNAQGSQKRDLPGAKLQNLQEINSVSFDQDISEYFRNLLMTLDEERFAGPRELFFGTLIKQVVCLKCKKPSSAQDEIFTDFILILPQEERRLEISTLLKDYFRPGQLDNYYCQKCTIRTNGEIGAQVKTLPQYLVLTIPRFQYDDGAVLAVKNTVQVHCAKVISLSEFCGSDKVHPEYELTVVIVHDGFLLSTGSYICYAQDKAINSKTVSQESHRSVWYRFNDHSKKQVSLPSFDSGKETLMLLIYERVSGIGSTKTGAVQPPTVLTHSDMPRTVGKRRVQDYGNTSYIECVIQVLYNCSSFREKILRILPRMGSGNSLTTTSALQRVFKTNEDSKGKSVYLDEIIQEFPPEDLNKDCTQFLRSLFSRLIDESCPGIEESFQGQLMRETICFCCETSNGANEEPFTDLILTLPERVSSVNISVLLRKYFESNRIYDYKCQSCRRENRTGETCVQVLALPQYLVLTLTIFQSESNYSTLQRKNMTKVTCDSTVDLTPFLLPGKYNDAKFALIGVIVHCGSSFDEQYKCYVRDFSGSGDNIRDRDNSTQWQSLGKKMKVKQLSSTSAPTHEYYMETPVVVIYERILNEKKQDISYPEHQVSKMDDMSSFTKTGLSNLGNTCFLNSVVQALYMCPGFQEIVLQYTPGHKHKITSALQSVFRRLKDSNGTAFSPSEFLSVSWPKWFQSGAQQDSSEYLRYLLDKLSEEGMKRAAALFTGLLVRNVTCEVCRQINSITPESFTDLMLHIPKPHPPSDVRGLLEHYFTASSIDSFLCVKCGKPTNAFLTVQLRELPEFLTLTILRFDHQRGGSLYERKNMADVSCNLEIEMEAMLDGHKPSRVSYVLIAVIVHCGHFASMGHYMCYARGPPENGNSCNNENAFSKLPKNEGATWYCFDDSYVRPVSTPTFEGYGMTPVVLIYQKKHEPGPSEVTEQNSCQDTRKLLQRRETQSQTLANSATSSVTHTATFKLQHGSSGNAQQPRCQQDENAQTRQVSKQQMNKPDTRSNIQNGTSKNKPVKEIVSDTVGMLRNTQTFPAQQKSSPEHHWHTDASVNDQNFKLPPI